MSNIDSGDDGTSVGEDEADEEADAADAAAAAAAAALSSAVFKGTDDDEDDDDGIAEALVYGDDDRDAATGEKLVPRFVVADFIVDLFLKCLLGEGVEVKVVDGYKNTHIHT